ncbi:MULTISPECIES: transposase [unclassified Caballeronia]|uniref:transposase n=1 Tax=unclassified Caballeronia TaxID=2646786 RepID=UPI002862B36D|nr:MULTISPECIES: transposase [unclassified Caballeronia]MDR5817186.1 transposase [Caballeronia sp. LZ033]MDR5824095.1 transposase [Caballeronia sp. LZ043]MDR5881989.1 transposase [Caballeronia sp. LZ032]
MFFNELSNDEWAMVSALIGESEVREHRRGRPRAHPRTIVNAVLWILTTGETWSKLPSHYPTVPTCRRRFVDWQMNGTLIEIVKVLANAGRSFAYVPRQPVAETAPRPVPPSYDCDRLRGVFWQNPESWQSRDVLPPGRGAAVPRRLPEARDVAQASASPVIVPRVRAPRPARPYETPAPFEPACAPVGDPRGYSIYPIARDVSGGMYRGWAEIVKDGRRVERSGLIGPRFKSMEEARSYALEWARRWIAAQATRADVARAAREAYVGEERVAAESGH